MTTLNGADTASPSADQAAVSLASLKILDPLEASSHGLDSSKPEMYGALSSLYDSLDPPAVASLEKAILFCHVRAFDEATKIFNSFPIELRHHPVAVYEHSMVYWLQWSLLDCAKVLQETLAWAEANAESYDQPGIYSLLRVFAGKLEVFTKGSLTKARDSMREIRAWLLDIPYTQYTEIQVKSKSRYLSSLFTI